MGARENRRLPIQNQHAGRAILHLCCLLLSAFCIAAFVASPALAAPPTTLPSADEMLAERVAQVEAQIAELALARPRELTDRQPAIDLRMDLRVLCRWYLLQSMQASPQSTLQVNAYVRAMTLASAAAEVDRMLEKSNLTPAQRTAANALHAFTYQLPQIKTAGDLDQASEKIGQLIQAIVPPTQRAQAMRPPPATRPARTEARFDAPAPQLPPLKELSVEARTMGGVDVALKAQLIELAERAILMSGEPGRGEEAKLLHETLGDAMQLLRGMQGSTMDADRRLEMQRRLAEGLAMFMDTRLRDAGVARLRSLDTYRQTLARIGRLRISPELAEELAPALAWAQANEEGPKLLAMIETVVQMSIQAQETPLPQLPPPFDAAAEALRASFEQHQGDFITDSASIGRGAMGTSLSDLQKHIVEMRRARDFFRTIEALSESYPSLAQIKIRPPASLDRRVSSALTDAAGPNPTPAREAAARFLQNVQALASVAALIERAGNTPLPPVVETAYTKGQLQFVLTKGRSILTDAANQAATSGSVDPGKMRSLETLQMMLAALEQATVFEEALAGHEVLLRWADWALTAPTLHRAMGPYRDALAGAFVGFLRDDAEALARYTRVRPRYQPTIDFVTDRWTRYGKTCASFPQGLAGFGAQLMTPLDEPSFATERYVAFALGLWARAESRSDFDGADRIALIVAARLR
jgi:hypothetical protein